MKLVAIFGGGYDSSQDNVAYSTDAMGNRIFMVDLLTGALLWRAGPSTDGGAQLQLDKMTNSIPADVRVLDMNEDGYADRMYAVDTGARIWRFDIWNGKTAAELVTGGVFASLGVADGTGTSPADARRFYHAPDVSLLVQEGVRFLNIAVGSGFRGSPLNTQIHDRFYSLRDYRPYTRLTQTQYNAWTPITDQTAGIEDATGTNAPTLTTTSIGWKMNLTLGGSWVGQKVLAESRTFGGQIFFTTYTPNSAAASCSVNPGTNRLYSVLALNGAKPNNRDSKVEDLTSGGIAPTPVFIFPSPDNPEDENSNAHLNDPNPDVICENGDCEPPPQCLTGLNNCGELPRVGRVRTFWTQQSVDD
jgi:type IV pilus assembly protein PilY1